MIEAVGLIPMRPVLSIPFLLALIVAAPSLSAQQVPATSPTTQPLIVELPPDSPIRGWFADLSNPDAAVRDKAVTQLMGMTRGQLESLRLLIQKNRPLSPNQAAALHDIVIHVFLAGEAYESEPRQPFLGVRWPPPDITFGGMEPPRLGVPLEERIPGFPGFQFLREGDVVISVGTHPLGPFDQLLTRPTPSKGILMEVLASAQPDKPVELEIVRQGQRMRVTVHLAPKPQILANNPQLAVVEAFLAGRLQRAEAYWEERFLPLLPQPIS